jgi:hypothetical protein
MTAENIAKLQALISQLTLAADGSNLSDCQRELILQAAEGLSRIDGCCIEWVVGAAERIAPIN